MFKIIRDHKGLKFTDMGAYLGSSDLTTLRAAVASFGHLVPLNTQMSATEFAAAIRQAYSQTNPRTRAVLQVLDDIAADWDRDASAASSIHRPRP